MVFNLFSEVVARAPTLISEQANLVKKVAFPLELLPFISIGSALFHFFLSTLILLVSILLLEHQLPVTILLLPVVIFPLLPMLLGLGWWVFLSICSCLCHPCFIQPNLLHHNGNFG